MMPHHASSSGVTVVRKWPVANNIGAIAAPIAAAICPRALPPNSRASSAVMTTSAPCRQRGDDPQAEQRRTEDACRSLCTETV